MLQELKTKEDIELFAKYKVDLIKLHQEYAKKLGLFDNKVDSYNKDNAIKNLNQKNLYQFLIKELQNKHYRIALECCNEMPTNYFYETLGMKNMKTNYILEYNNE